MHCRLPASQTTESVKDDRNEKEDHRHNMQIRASAGGQAMRLTAQVTQFDEIDWHAIRQLRAFSPASFITRRDGRFSSRPADGPVTFLGGRPRPQLSQRSWIGAPPPGGIGGSRIRSWSRDFPLHPTTRAKTKTTAPPRATSACAQPLSSAPPTAMRKTPATRNLGYQAVRRVRVSDRPRDVCAGVPGTSRSRRCDRMPLASSFHRLPWRHAHGTGAAA